MNFLDFKNREIKVANGYEKISMDLQLNDMLDNRFSTFVSTLDTSIRNYLSSINLEESQKPILFKFYTDLNKDDLMISRDQIIEAVARAIIVTTKEYKNGEKILGLPDTFKHVDMLRAVILNLINYPLRYEVINFVFIDKDGNQVADTI
ncbi:MAG: hypothetical protein ACOCRO_05530 [Halanaerobiales bacterium]